MKYDPYMQYQMQMGGGMGPAGPNTSTLMQMGHGMANPDMRSAASGQGAPISAVPGVGGNTAMPGAAGVNPMAGLAGMRGTFGGLHPMQNMSAILSGIGSLGQAFAAVKGVRTAQDQLKFQKKAFKTNLKNQTQNYNTTLENKANHMDAWKDGGGRKASDYIDRHRL